MLSNSILSFKKNEDPKANPHFVLVYYFSNNYVSQFPYMERQQ